jgi:DNA-binding CsgD family transcriptional regulator/tetratricopeptide (TPR) repeat protein
LELTELAQEISEEIEHEEWRIATHCVLGALYFDIFALSQARQHLELALTRGREIGSSVWIGTVTGYLASVCILQNELSRAKTVLDAELRPDVPAQTQMQRLCWCARAELALASGEADLALSVIDRLIASDPNGTPTAAIPRLSILRSEALVALHRPVEAERELQIAQAATFEQGARAWSWRIHLALGKLYQAQARRLEAEEEFNAAQNIIDALAATIQDQTLCGSFLEHAMSMIPMPSPISSRRVEKEKFGGLTAREREVAALISRGMSNRGIAEALVVSERTVETHITNILAKLGFNSRAGIAVWALNKGLG